MSVAVEFPIEEAEGILARLAPDPHGSLSAAQCDAAERGRDRLERAVKIERGPGGNAEEGRAIDESLKREDAYWQRVGGHDPIQPAITDPNGPYAEAGREDAA